MQGENYRSLDLESLINLADIGIAEAQDELGYRLLRDNVGNEEKLKEAVEWFSMAAEKGNLNSMFNLASMYKMGIGVDIDYNKALELYKTSADKGLNISKYFLSEMYKRGLGIEKNEEKAMELVAESFSGKVLVAN